MKPRIAPKPQDRQFHDDATSADADQFNAWLDSLEGQRWLESEAESNADQLCTSNWEGW